mmetsp:Transcript_83476/g.131907  ORF Transcript_83476/g.131907 Transcript_83476/m.131907 type:complete len:262 (+) Transcript_83476:54-839(+)|eukprot:CAMPEP_0169099816 /NCGR_PEP_ID=MMETSP1015-20121227/20756_1 /TAXON_ID=342587 /ORGANISM="Karlodinium micrum, Strain CCMP2283" /LENGTH=261 /DNA_ID=CAMNT_0009160717 /DNA_START=52 /DNA_END=837 /DNA_ORIENTATION=+
MSTSSTSQVLFFSLCLTLQSEVFSYSTGIGRLKPRRIDNASVRIPSRAFLHKAGASLREVARREVVGEKVEDHVEFVLSKSAAARGAAYDGVSSASEAIRHLRQWIVEHSALGYFLSFFIAVGIALELLARLSFARKRGCTWKDALPSWLSRSWLCVAGILGVASFADCDDTSVKKPRISKPALDVLEAWWRKEHPEEIPAHPHFGLRRGSCRSWGNCNCRVVVYGDKQAERRHAMWQPVDSDDEEDAPATTSASSTCLNR